MITGFKARHKLSIVYVEQGRWREADNLLRNLIHETPFFAPCWSLLGDVHLRQGQLPAAQELAEQMLSQRELNCGGLLLQAQIVQAAGYPDRARQPFQKALQQHPNNVEVLNAWCRFLFEHGTLEEAEKALLRLATIDGEQGAAFHNLGTIHARALDESRKRREPTKLRLNSVRMPHTSLVLLTVEIFVSFANFRGCEPKFSDCL